MKALDAPIFFFNDQRVRYTANQIRVFVEDGVTAPDTPVRIIEAAFKASDIIEHIAPMLCDRLLSEIDEEVVTADCLK